MRHAFAFQDDETEIWLSRAGAGYRLHCADGEARIALGDAIGSRRRLVFGGIEQDVHVATEGETLYIHLDGTTHVLRHLDPVRRFAETEAGGGADMARAPMPGTVVRIEAVLGQKVVAGDPILVIESMKLETTIRAWQDGEIGTIHVSEGQSFDRDAPLVSLTANEA
jgi:biotin carboxyl carrier protein